MRKRTALLAAIGLGIGVAVLGSCALSDTGPAEIWTDVPEIALCAELFNASQNRYLIEVQWQADLGAALRGAKEPPALAIGRFLKSQAVRDRFLSLDYLFGELLVNQAAFYPGLLSLGNVEGRQLLLPVSFNLPAIIFPRGSPGIKNDFILGIEDLAKPAAAYNQKEGTAYVRMGFSPRWDGDFLVLAANAAGASFREGKPLAWNEQGLRAAIQGIGDWTVSVNGSAALEDDFQFKYLYTPAYQYVSAGRTLFAYVDSASFFLIPEEKRSALDYRWFAHAGAVPISEELVYAGMIRAGRGKQAAEAFLKWFFTEEAQRAILESGRRARALESSFGIAGGFSSLRAVNEKVFPLFYPALVGHLPPAESMSSPNVLPSDWPELERAVVAPWLLQVTARAKSVSGDPGQELANRLADYRRKSASP